MRLVRRLLSVLLLVALTCALTMSAAAFKRDAPTTTAKVVGVVSGATLLVEVPATAVPQPAPKPVVKKKPVKKKRAVRRLAATTTIEVPILGIHAPSGTSCYAKESAAAASSLAVGKDVTFVGDLKAGAYALLPGGVDLGAQLLERGAVQLDTWNAPTSKFQSYVPVEQAAESAARGLWGACAADLVVTQQGPDTGFVGQFLKYDVTVQNNGPLVATDVRIQVRPGAYREKFDGVDITAGTCTPTAWMATCSVQGIQPGGSVKLTYTIHGTNFGGMSARAEASLVDCLAKSCGAAPLIDPNPSNNHAATTTLLPGGGYERACDKSYPTVCIQLTPPDLDCADFLPLRAFPVRYDVANPDPHHLDGNGDGLACNGEDY